MTWPRHLLRGLLADLGEPYLAVRLGYRAGRTALPQVLRRDSAGTITIQQ